MEVVGWEMSAVDPASCGLGCLITPGITMRTSSDAPGITSFTDEQLVRVARLFASDDSLAAHLDDLPADGNRRRASLAGTPHLEMWAITWPPGSTSGWHDHGAASGAFVVVRGSLLEEVHLSSGEKTTRVVTADEHRWLAPGLIHRTSAFGDSPALTVHAYAPSLAGARTYESAELRTDA